MNARKLCRGVGLALTLIAPCGCMIHAGVELAAADALDLTRQRLDSLFAVYHEEILRFDEQRANDVAHALAERMRTAPDEAARKAHADEFMAAFRRIKADMEAESARRAYASEANALIAEVAGGLRSTGTATVNHTNALLGGLPLTLDLLADLVSGRAVNGMTVGNMQDHSASLDQLAQTLRGMQQNLNQGTQR